MKQTAVEWLKNEFREAHKMFGGIDTNWIKRFEKAEAMEKEQIINAFDKGLITENAYYGYDDEKAEQYYNETFKSE